MAKAKMVQDQFLYSSLNKGVISRGKTFFLFAYPMKKRKNVWPCKTNKGGGR